MLPLLKSPPMPKVAIDKYHNPWASKNKVRLPWKLSHIFTIPQTPSKQQVANDQLRLGVHLANPGHSPTALLRGHIIRHLS